MLERVTSEILAESFLSDDFQKNLIKAGRITKRTGNETAFCSTYYLLGNTFDVTSVIEGGPDSVSPPIKEKGDSAIVLNSLHYHPGSTGPLVPSFQDLRNISTLDELDCLANGGHATLAGYTSSYPNYDRCKGAIYNGNIRSIAKLRENGSIEVLSYGPSRMGFDVNHSELLSEGIDEFLLDSDCYYAEDTSLGIINSDIGTDEVVEVLRNSGYCNAIVLEYPRDIKNSEGRKRFRESNLEKFVEKLKVFEKKILYSTTY